MRSEVLEPVDATGLPSRGSLRLTLTLTRFVDVEVAVAVAVAADDEAHFEQSDTISRETQRFQTRGPHRFVDGHGHGHLNVNESRQRQRQRTIACGCNETYRFAASHCTTSISSGALTR